MPWEFFLGHAAHRLIAYMYKVERPDDRVYFNTDSLAFIISNESLGDASRLAPDARNLRPDITDIDRLYLFEIKPRTEQGEAGQWVDLTEEELRQFGGWVGQAVAAMVERRERLATVQGSVGVAIELIGTAATTFFSGVILQQMGSGPGAQQPPTQGAGRVLPFPARPPLSSVSAPGSAAAAWGLGP